MTVVTHILPACSVPGFPGEPVLAHLARSSCMWLPHVSACDGHSQHPFFVKEFGHCRHFILVNRQTHLTDLHWSQDSRDNCHHSQTAFLLLVFSFFHCYLFIYKHICQIRSRNSQRLKAFPHDIGSFGCWSERKDTKIGIFLLYTSHCARGLILIIILK